MVLPTGAFRSGARKNHCRTLLSQRLETFRKMSGSFRTTAASFFSAWSHSEARFWILSQDTADMTFSAHNITDLVDSVASS
jgi:hypothetical protein